MAAVVLPAAWPSAATSAATAAATRPDIVLNVAAREPPREQYILINLSARENEDVLARIAREFASPPGRPVRVGVGRIFSYFGRRHEQLDEELRAFLDLCARYDLSVLVALDGEYWWEGRPDLWNWWQPDQPGYNPANRENVEWLHQGPNTPEAWRASLERTLADPRCRFLCIFNWRNIAEKPAALTALRAVVTNGNDQTNRPN